MARHAVLSGSPSSQLMKDVAVGGHPRPASQKKKGRGGCVGPRKPSAKMKRRRARDKIREKEAKRRLAHEMAAEEAAARPKKTSAEPSGSMLVTVDIRMGDLLVPMTMTYDQAVAAGAVL